MPRLLQDGEGTLRDSGRGCEEKGRNKADIKLL